MGAFTISIQMTDTPPFTKLRILHYQTSILCVHSYKVQMIICIVMKIFGNKLKEMNDKPVSYPENFKFNGCCVFSSKIYW